MLEIRIDNAGGVHVSVYRNPDGAITVPIVAELEGLFGSERSSVPNGVISLPSDVEGIDLSTFGREVDLMDFGEFFPEIPEENVDIFHIPQQLREMREASSFAARAAAYRPRDDEEHRACARKHGV